MKNHIQEISKSIRKGELTIFCGAGISKNSGLPLANELKQQILDKLPIDDEGKKEIMNSNLPFEAFIEAISKNNVDISKILDIFDDGIPNTNHILIARLAKQGYLKTIFTTNFDLLIERALKDEGLENNDFEVFYDEKQFAEIDFENRNEEIIRVFKIHGSVEDKESIRTTLEMVASRTLSEKRMSLIQHLFSTGRHEKIIILGYSCSDEFDITPQIEDIAENQKEIIFVEHSNIEEIEDIKVVAFKNPFKRFPGKRIKCNTDDFIKGLWDSLKGIVGEYNPVKSKTEWETYVDDWAKGLEKDKSCPKYLIAAPIFYMVSDFTRAIKYLKESLAIAKENRDSKGESLCYGNLGIAYRNLGDIEKAFEHYKKSLKIAKRIEYREQEVRCYIYLGVAYQCLPKPKFKMAIRYHEKALDIAKAIRNKRRIENRISECYANLGAAYLPLKKFRESISYSRKSLRIK